MKIPAFILIVRKELFRHSGMFLAGIQDGEYGWFLDRSLRLSPAKVMPE
ncbi:MAG: hypothetical protein J7L69_05635 [Desulfobulbaceae bacterium]|nr:hypothetical protein [Desulfobulbaceae bacterium]